MRGLFNAFGTVPLSGVRRFSTTKSDLVICTAQTTFVRAIGDHLFLVNVYAPDVEVVRDRETLVVRAHGQLTRFKPKRTPDFMVHHSRTGPLYDVSIVPVGSDLGELSDSVEIDLDSL